MFDCIGHYGILLRFLGDSFFSYIYIYIYIYCDIVTYGWDLLHFPLFLKQVDNKPVQALSARETHA